MSKQSWKAVRDRYYPGGNVYNIEADCTDEQDIVAEVYGDKSRARLVAAAPEMLAELKSILEALARLGLAPKRQDRIRQIIAKIEEPVS